MTTLAEVLARLDRFTNHEVVSSSGIAAGALAGVSLDSMERLCALLGDPQHATPTIHVTGTNGKGSVSAMISELLTATGLSVGAYSSPHLSRVNERLRRDGQPISDDDLAEALDGVLAVVDLLDVAPSWFEIMTAAAFRWFSEAPVDVAVVEVGLLGRFDATNVVTAEVAVVTNIGPDHTDFSDGWLAKIAFEKAGIVTSGNDVVVGQLSPTLLDAVALEHPSRVLALGRDIDITDARLAYQGRTVSFSTPWGDHEDVTIPVHGAHQGVNFAIATTAVEAFFDRRLDDAVVEHAAGSVLLPCRIDVLARQPLVIVDGAHNPDAAARLAETIDEEFAPLGSRVLVLGMLEGRDPSAFLEALTPARFDVVVATTPETPRALPSARLAHAAEAAGWVVSEIADPMVAIERVLADAGEEDMIVIAGSFYLVGPARSLLLGRLAD